MEESMSAEPTYIVYDGDCPFCSAYVRLVRLRQAIGPVELVNARDPHPALNELRALRINLDEGMAIKFQGTWRTGADCMNLIARLSGRSNAVNKAYAAVFSSPRLSRLLYPTLRAGRNAALWIMGRTKIKNLA
jgi:predicted DCC family thiol-disulfide oxidoreductase YuxK